jgi:hypothetical protein
LTVYFTNSSKPINLVTVRATLLQTKTGYDIPNSSITVSAQFPLVVSRAVTFNVTVRIPSQTRPGNYTGQLVLIGANGGVSTESLSITVTYTFLQYFGAYWGDLFWVILGVAVSYVYSPVSDVGKKKANASYEKKREKDVKEAETKGQTKEQIEATYPRKMSRSQAAKTYVKETLNTRVHPAIFLTGAAIGIVIFSSFLTATPGFGVSAFHDAAISILDGFAVHRLLDGTISSAKDGNGGK